MSAADQSPDIQAGRLDRAQIDANFADIHPLLTLAESRIESDRCYFCHDAPCIAACPTGIDIPLFIRQIAAGNPKGAARTILDENILGGMCARVCPTETLCEQACVRNTAEEQPVRIGELQRYATDTLLATGEHPFTRAAETGRHVAVVGAGPAGLACAHRLAMYGHRVTVYEAKPKPGGLNEYGIAAYKTVDDFAQREVDWLLAIGGITIAYDSPLSAARSLESLREAHDAVFLGMGLPNTNGLGIPGEDLPGVADAVDYIAGLRQAADRSDLPVGRRVVVIGGGMTAVDIAMQSRHLGAESVTIAYRRGQGQMAASDVEQRRAQTNGILLATHLAPKAIHANNDGQAVAITFDRVTSDEAGSLVPTGETVTLPADMIFKAIGQAPDMGLALAGLTLERGRIPVDPVTRRSALPDVWAGGDCVLGGQDLTVSAVEDGKRAAEDINRTLMAAPAVAAE